MCRDGRRFVVVVAVPRVPVVTEISDDDTARKHLVRRFRSEHPDLFPTDIPDRPATEFLDQCAVLFQCTACGSVYHFEDSTFHGTECPVSSPVPWSIESSAPAKHNIVALALSLLEVLELPQATTLSSATEGLRDIRFICLCGDPRYEGHFDFTGLVGTFSFIATLAPGSVLHSLATSSPRIKSTKRLNQRSLERHGIVHHTIQLSRTLSL